MARLSYMGLTSLDGYLVDANGDFDWSMPDEAVHATVNDLQRSIGTYLYGRRIWEVMKAWQTMGTDAAEPAVIRDFAEVWRAADKIVYSTTLTDITESRTRLEHNFDPAAIRDLKASEQRDLGIGGGTLAAHAVRAGLVDDYHQFLSPVIVGGGIRFFPDDARLDLELVNESRFDNGVVHLQYRAKS